MDFHPAANIFPLDDEHTDELARDIKSNGLRLPIVTLDGKILDGRRRFMACRIAGVTPRFEQSDTDDPVAFVLSLNLHRRHLTVSQAAMCAARARDLYEKQAKERQKAGLKRGDAAPVRNKCSERGKASEAVGRVFGVSGGSVDRARRVIDNGLPELVEAVDSGKVTVAKAASIAGHEPELQRDLLEAESKKERKRSPKAKPAEEDNEPRRGKPGVGVELANEAINCLIRIPKNDPLRKRGFQIVTDWIRRNQ